MNNKCFILMDALVAFMMLATFILFFNQVIAISQKEQMSYTSELLAVNSLREKAYEQYTGENIELKNDVSIYKSADNYCAKYKGIDGTEEICI